MFLGERSISRPSREGYPPGVPDVAHGTGQFDMSHPFTPDAGLGHFDAAFIANDALVAYSLVFTAETFVVLGGAEYSFAEQTVSFRFKSPVVDSLGLGYFTVRPALDLFRRSQRNPD